MRYSCDKISIKKREDPVIELMCIFDQIRARYYYIEHRIGLLWANDSYSKEHDVLQDMWLEGNSQKNQLDLFSESTHSSRRRRCYVFNVGSVFNRPHKDAAIGAPPVRV
jgi:hypothetical protein